MKPRHPKFWFFLLLLFTGTLPAFCQQIIFNRVLPPEGGFSPLVTCITQDKNGYMWFATPNGLYSYDGYRFTTSYVHDSLNPHSLATNYVESIYTDSNGIIWTGTQGAGLDRLDPETGIFTHFHHNANDPASLGNDNVNVILKDKQGIFWIGTDGGLDQFDPKTKKFIHYRYNVNDSTSISNNRVRAIYEDRQGTIWIGTGIPGAGRPEEGGLNRMNKKTGTFTRYLNIPGNIHSLSNNKVRAIFEDNQGVLWIGTAGNGLHKMDRKQGVFERIVYDPAHPEKISGPAFKKESKIGGQITFIIQDAAGSYWIGTLEDGLNYYNPVIGKTIHYPGTKNSSAGFNDIGVWCTFTSRDGILWISTDWTRGNVYRIAPFQREIPHYKIPGGVVCFYEEPNGIFWTAGEELIRNDIDKGIKKRYKIINPTSGEYIAIIKGDLKGNFWVGTSVGLKLWNKKKDNFITYKNEPGNKTSLSNDFVNTIYEDRDSNLWIGTFRGFNLWNNKTGSFTQYLIFPNDSSLAGEGSVSAILRDKTDRLWIGTWGGGVNLFNRESNKFKNYLKGITVSCMYEDADAALWLGGNDGLYKYDRSADVFIRYKVLGSFTEIPDVSHMVEDNQKYLWLQTSDGLMSLNPRRDEARNYGISKTSFGEIGYYNYCYKGRDGKLYFAESGGYYSFYSTDLNQHIKPLEIIFTGFSLGGKLIKPGNQGPLKQSISKTAEIRLQYNQNVFSLEFAAIDYTNPEDNRHFYMLENYDHNWQPAGSDRKASYFNIPTGKYVFRVKAANSKGAWAEKKINIIILPPWWETWWFRTLAVTALILLFYGIYRWRTAALRKQKRILEQTVIVRTAEVVKQKEKSDELLLNILPSEVAEELKEKGYTTAKAFEEVTVLFSDIKGFTNVAEKMTAQELVKEINIYFSAFDGIIQKYGLEKIKTIGDAYIAAGGLPEKNAATAQNVVEAAIAMQQAVEKLKQERVSSNKPYFELRIGIHTGPVVAGVVGIKKFQYDIWGDTVNLAARMEQSGVPGKINISQHTYEFVKNQFTCSHRGKIEAKNKGEIDMYFVE